MQKTTNRSRRGVLWASLVLVGALLYVAVGVARDYGVDDGGDGRAAVMDTDEPSLGEVAFHGDDYSRVSAESGLLLVCDVENDDNVVKGVIDIVESGSMSRVEVADATGDRRCASFRPSGPVQRHRVCERNHLFWRCGNWQVGS
jgi:hypothetical protein